VRDGNNAASGGAAPSGDSARGETAQVATGARSAESARVFLSYSDDSEVHRTAIDELARLLASWGARVSVDTAAQRPPQGWAQWSVSKFAEADVILMICTTEYRRRVERREVPGRGRGATWEGPLLSDLVYDGTNAFGRIGTVLLEGATVDAIPAAFRTAPRFRVPGDADSLRAWLTQPLRKRRLLERVAADLDVDPLADELELYVSPGERDLAAYLRDLEALRDFDPRDDASEASSGR
jgi:SEFIR domain